MLAACAPWSRSGSSSSCSSDWRPVPPPSVAVGPWQAPLGREHPLVGRMWDVRSARFVTPEGMVRRAHGRSRFVLLGEKHDNPDNHQVQAGCSARSWRAAGGRSSRSRCSRPTTRRQSPAHRRGAPRDAAGLGPAVDWKHSGWPDWAYYQPIAQAALDAGVPIVGGQPHAGNRASAGSRPALRAADQSGGALRARPAALGALQAALTTEIREAHCGHFPADRVDGMVLAQRARDSALAESLLAGSDGAVLIAGTGHIRNDRGVPIYLRLRAPDATIATLAPLEVRRADAAGGLRGGRTAARCPSTGCGSRHGWTTTIPARDFGNRMMGGPAGGPSTQSRSAATGAEVAVVAACGGFGVVGIGEHGDSADLGRLDSLNAAFHSCSAFTRSSTHASREVGAPLRSTRACVSPPLDSSRYRPAASRSTRTSPPSARGPWRTAPRRRPPARCRWCRTFARRRPVGNSRGRHDQVRIGYFSRSQPGVSRPAWMPVPLASACRKRWLPSSWTR